MCSHFLALTSDFSPLCSDDRLVRPFAWRHACRHSIDSFGLTIDPKMGLRAGLSWPQTPQAEKERKSRWDFGSEVAASTRCFGSEKEVGNVPYFDNVDLKYVPTRSTFLLRSNPTLLDDPYIPFFTRIGGVSLEEIITRIRVSLAFWTTAYYYIQFPCSVFALINVSLRAVDLKLWRLAFGSIKTCYTIHGFWGNFWQQNLQLQLKGPAEFITHTILRISPGTIFARYSKVFFTFAVSGLLHAASDYGGAVPFTQSGALRFFCTQALGIMLEDGIQGLYRRIFGNRKRLLREAVGYIWVFAWLCWSTPAWVYPVARTMERRDVLLTLDALVSPFLSNLW
ncbi:uncharacterized protein PAC_13569 [Phialocephala subalpina]|uniref:Wax synthase domain-containing protein n=1 Tax=Phialocephala subalpina TaxID=576137 RepID=A0A1L7XF67_9HELO|nr:uncharacterized protein PAC_13569 [Phialocephala subalpina]